MIEAQRYDLVPKGSIGSTDLEDDGLDGSEAQKIYDLVPAGSIGSMDLEDDGVDGSGGRRRRWIGGRRWASAVFNLLERLSQASEERCALVFSLIAMLLSFITVLLLATNHDASASTADLEMESSQADISALYQQVSQLQASNQLLADELALLKASGDDSSTEWLNDFVSVKVDENNGTSLFITAPVVSLGTPQAKTITQLIQGQNNWVWSSDLLDCHVGDTITWDWSTNENIIEADSMFNPMYSPSFSSGTLTLGGSYSHVFTAPGTHYFMSQNTASLSGTIVVYPGNVQARNGMLQLPTSGSGAALRPACTFDAVGTLYMERDMISVCMEHERFDQRLSYGFAQLATFVSESVYAGYEYATMDGCPENPDTGSSCMTETQYGEENAIALPSGWSIATWSSSSSSYAYQYFHGNWGATHLVAKYSSTTYMWQVNCGATGSCSSTTTIGDYYNCDYSSIGDYYNYGSSSDCIRISSSGDKYYITAGYSQSHSSTYNWKILIRRAVS